MLLGYNIPVSSCTVGVPASASQRSAGTEQTSDTRASPVLSDVTNIPKSQSSHSLLMSSQTQEIVFDSDALNAFFNLFFFYLVDPYLGE